MPPKAAPRQRDETDEPLLLREDAAGIATLTLNREKARNALSRALMAELTRQIEALAGDNSIRVVILAAKGNAFCAGHDLKELRAIGDKKEYENLFAECSRLMMAVVSCPKPVIAQVQGMATAAGCQLVASCDLAVASSKAMFATPGVNIGLFCSTPMVALSRNVGRKKAMEMLLTGEAIPAEMAVKIGLANRMVKPAQLAAETRKLAALIAAKSPLALAVGKEAFYRQLEMPLQEAYAYASAVMARNMMAEDAREGIDAFLEKRAPRWRGC